MDKAAQIRDAFGELLKQKTSWGRNELKKAFDEMYIEIMDGGSTEKISSDSVIFSNTEIKMSQKTGEFRFQFDDEDSERIADILDFNPVSLIFNQQKSYAGYATKPTEMVFTSKSGKVFKLFIDNKMS